MMNQSNPQPTTEATNHATTTNYQTMTEPNNGGDGLVVASTEESHTRSLLKGISWRFVATMTTVFIAWAVLGEVGTAFQIGFFEVFAKIAIYYVHERIWAKIPV